MSKQVVLQTSIGQVPVRRGKVRDVYDLGDRLLLVSTDRISAFDWVLPSGIPDKGRVLTQVAAFWFGQLGVPHHLISTDLAEMNLPQGADRACLAGRASLVRKTEVVPIECVVRGYLAERALAEKQYPEAARVFGEMHDIAPQNPLVLNNLAWSANQVKDPKALEYAEQAHALAPDNAAILDTLGVIQIARGEAQKGFANLERAVELAPDAAQLRLNLARAYADAGRSTDARKQLDTLMPRLTEGSPLHAEATKLLKSL